MFSFFMFEKDISCSAMTQNIIHIDVKKSNLKSKFGVLTV